MSLAETEHKRIVGNPPVARPGIVSTKPGLVTIPVEVEDARVVIGAGNLLHGDVVEILQASSVQKSHVVHL